MSAEVITVFAFGVVFIITMLVLAVAFPTPSSFQYATFRIVLALAAAGIAAMIPGFINVELTSTFGLLLRAGGALAVFVIVFFFSPARLAVDAQAQPSKPSTMVVRAEVQRFHIIRGATEAPRLLPPVETKIADYETAKRSIVQQIIAATRPTNKLEVSCSIDGQALRVSRPVDVFAAGFGVQGIGSHRQIATATPDTPIDLDRLFSGGYPGPYFVETNAVTLWFQMEDGYFYSERLLVQKKENGYSLGDEGQQVTSVVLTARPATILIRDFESAGSDEGQAKQIALDLRSAVREEIAGMEDFKLSPHEWSDLLRVHAEVKNLPAQNPGKSMAVGDYGVDLIVRGSVELR